MTRKMLAAGAVAVAVLAMALYVGALQQDIEQNKGGDEQGRGGAGGHLA